MDIRPIHNDDDHTQALREVERLWGAQGGTPDGDKLDVLWTLTGAYEDRRWPIASGSPRDVLEYAVAEMGRSQKELAGLLNSRSQAADLLNGRRHISLKVARKVSEAWKIPIQLLVAPYPDDRTRSQPAAGKAKRAPQRAPKSGHRASWIVEGAV